MATLVGSLNVNSPVIRHEGGIPVYYTCDGENVNPPIAIQNIPQEAISLVLIMDDPDAPGQTFDHWIVYNIPPEQAIGERDVPGVPGRNSSGENGYTGPCPPVEMGTHRYFFKLYALDTMLDLEAGADKKTVEQAMEGHVLATGELIGLYKKIKK